MQQLPVPLWISRRCTLRQITSMHKKRLTIYISVALLVIVMGTVGYFYLSSTRNLEDVSVIKNLIGRHYVLPTDEEPALATVEDKTKIKSEFFRSAENGDKLLVYKNAKKVILYRPSTDRIIEVGPVSIADMNK